ncbi:TonB-linked SusC/RagA family outer membrane protein [Catalinimonas alkaloidigena]|uniref:SusC/RagA family TonB-linked outer membrane protein n=1 Tax=Catalinimonas alkaloidigena TaxID=1075417 RepID=UPI002404C449|nr:TonB-dependent receptor [Catalinimonas alkaloidigena]MDF9798800.1 TonB-linked SusC/RagA family outer membrane protein [Catalinimonas alkaloidigena]
MSKLLLQPARLLLWCLLGSMVMPLQAQQLASLGLVADPVKQKRKEQKLLIHFLEELGESHKVNFFFDEEHVNEQLIQETAIGEEKLEVVLQKVLSPLGLKSTRLDESNYMIEKKAARQNVDNVPNIRPTLKQGSSIYPKLTTVHRIAMDNRRQVLVITGKVTSQEGNEPLPGVNVLVKGTTQGTITDIGGNYSLEAPEEGTLVFSSVGYLSWEEAIDNRSVINITLQEDISQLEEIVVVGYGEQKKVNLTGSVAAVEGDELVQRPVSNPTNLLQGRVSGVQITQPFAKPGDERNSIRIRGTGTFSSAGSDPLVLINGVAGDMSNLNPDDIESISVLKDAASSAIYGARAANGVILVTTKEGKNRPLSISYHGNVQAHQATRLPELLTNSADYMELWNEARIRGGAAPHFSQATIDAFRNNPNDPVNYPNFDWIDHSFRTGLAQNHHLSLNGGNDKTAFNLSVGYFDQDGITSIYDFKKYSSLFSINSQVTDWLKLGGQIQFVKKDITKSAWDNDVDYQILAIYGAGPNYTPTMTLPDGSTGYVARYSPSIAEWTVRNPDAQDASGSIIQDDYNIMPQFFADIQLHDNLTWKTKVAFSLTDGFYKGHEHPVDNYFFEDGSYAHNNATWRLGVRETASQSTLTTLYSTLNYEKDFKGGHYLNALAGYNQESFFSRSLNGSRQLFPTNELKELDAGSPEGQSTGGSAYEWAISSFFGRLAYNYNDKYLIEANARYDGTSRISPDNRWGFFPSVSGAWRISEEAFAQGVSWLDNLKLRASWGKLGNQNVGIYPYQEVLSTTAYPFGSSTSAGVRQTRLVDQDLKWETTTMTDIGLDLVVNGGVFNATIDWYDKVTDDILYNIPVPASVGLAAPTVNFGKMSNTGIELALGHGQQLGDFGYNISVNASRNRNEVDRILAPAYGERTIQEGLPWNSHYLVEWVGIFQNQAEIDEGPEHPFNPKPGDLKYKDQNGDNRIDADDRVVVDGAYPDFIYGGSMNLSWKNLSLTAFFQGVEGQKVNNRVLSWGLGNYMQGSPPPVEFVENRWTSENSTNSYPAMFANGYGPVTGTASTYWLQDASYFRLKNLLIEYHLPVRLTENIGLKDLRVYASGDNLFTITDYPGADPEAFDNNWFTAYPQVRILTLGVRVKL